MLPEWIQRLIQILKRYEVTQIPAGATEVNVSHFEQKTGIRMPSELSAWLMATNGPFVGGQGLFGVGGSRDSLNIDYYYRMFPEWLIKRWIPLGTDGTGNMYVVITQGEYGEGYPVVFVDTLENYLKPAYIVASSVKKFLYFFVEHNLKLANWHWPFDEAKMRILDSEITTYSGVPLPRE